MSRLTEKDCANSRSAGVGFAQAMLSGLPETAADLAINKIATQFAKHVAIEAGYTPVEQAELQRHFTKAAKAEWRRLLVTEGNAGHGFT